VLHHHHNKEVLHHSLLCVAVWQFSNRPPVVWCLLCVHWTYTRQHLRQNKEKSLKTVLLKYRYILVAASAKKSNRIIKYFHSTLLNSASLARLETLLNDV